MTTEEREYLEKDFERVYSKKLKQMEKRAFFQRKRAELGLKKMQTSKKLVFILMAFTALSFVTVIAYCMWAMFKLGDLGAMDTLITVAVGTPVTLTLEYLIYSLKAYAETRESERIQLEREKLHNSESLE